jgi:histidinol phosphatase-like enzyme
MKTVMCLDQEGVITANHESKPGGQYFNIFPRDVELLPDVIRAFEILWQNHVDVYIITNQAWVTIAAISEDDTRALKALDATKRARIVQCLGKYSELIRGWRKGYVVGDGIERSRIKAHYLGRIAQIYHTINNPEMARGYWIGDTISDLKAGELANRLSSDGDYKYLMGAVIHGNPLNFNDRNRILDNVAAYIPEYFKSGLPFYWGYSLYEIVQRIFK